MDIVAALAADPDADIEGLIASSLDRSDEFRARLAAFVQLADDIGSGLSSPFSPLLVQSSTRLLPDTVVALERAAHARVAVAVAGRGDVWGPVAALLLRDLPRSRAMLLLSGAGLPERLVSSVAELVQLACWTHDGRTAKGIDVDDDGPALPVRVRLAVSEKGAVTVHLIADAGADPSSATFHAACGRRAIAALAGAAWATEYDGRLDYSDSREVPITERRTEWPLGASSLRSAPGPRTSWWRLPNTAPPFAPASAQEAADLVVLVSLISSKGGLPLQPSDFEEDLVAPNPDPRTFRVDDLSSDFSLHIGEAVRAAMHRSAHLLLRFMLDRQAKALMSKSFKWCHSGSVDATAAWRIAAAHLDARAAALLLRELFSSPVLPTASNGTPDEPPPLWTTNRTEASWPPPPTSD